MCLLEKDQRLHQPLSTLQISKVNTTLMMFV